MMNTGNNHVGLFYGFLNHLHDDEHRGAASATGYQFLNHLHDDELAAYLGGFFM